MENLNELLKKLLQTKIDFVIVGGFAGIVHGASQVTQDLDICLLINEEQITTLRNCLADINPKHRMLPQKPSFLEEPRNTSNINNLYLETDLGVIDIISEVTGLGGFKRIQENAISVPLFGHDCLIMGLDDLIQVKKNLDRPKDKALLIELTEIRKKL